MTKDKIIVALDGHASCGKSTMAKQLAKAVGYTYIDTGAMYRAVTLHAIRTGCFLDDGNIDEARLAGELNKIAISFAYNPDTGRSDTMLNGENVERAIREMEVSSRVSPIATLGFVRKKLVAEQQRMGHNKGIVMDGRDIATVVFPDAEMKVFVTARPEVRARRRYEELVAKGSPADYDDILHNVKERDRIDSTREVSPLKPAPDSIILDNSDMTIEEQNKWLKEHFERCIHHAKDGQ